MEAVIIDQQYFSKVETVVSLELNILIIYKKI